jgi:hypothetical protein
MHSSSKNIFVSTLTSETLRRVVLFFILFFNFNNLGQCQTSGESGRDSTRGSAGFEIKTTYGFLIVHRPVLEILQEQHAYGLEFSYLKPADGSKSFQEKFLFPDVGWTIAWFNLGNPDRLGSGIAVYPFINFPLHIKKDWRFHVRYGIGLGYVEKVFDAKENVKNAAIGTHLNGVMHFDLNIEKEISDKTLISLGAGITHYSNGSTGIPNLGINMATANLSVMHYFGEKKAIHPNSKKIPVRKGEFQGFLAGAFKKIYPPKGKTYAAGTVSFSYFHPIKQKSSWGIGLDLFYDNSLQERLERAEKTGISNGDNLRPGIYGSYELRLGHIGLLANMGVYPYTKWKGDGNFYHRIGSRYYFDKLYLLMNLKTHFAKADFIEWGIGYSFEKNKSRSRN